MKQDKATSSLLMVYELDTSSKDYNTLFALGDYLFEVVKITKNDDPDKCGYSYLGIGFYARSQILLTGELVRNVAIFDVKNS